MKYLGPNAAEVLLVSGCAIWGYTPECSLKTMNVVL